MRSLGLLMNFKAEVLGIVVQLDLVLRLKLPAIRSSPCCTTLGSWSQDFGDVRRLPK